MHFVFVIPSITCYPYSVVPVCLILPYEWKKKSTKITSIAIECYFWSFIDTEFLLASEISSDCSELHLSHPFILNRISQITWLFAWKFIRLGDYRNLNLPFPPSVLRAELSKVMFCEMSWQCAFQLQGIIPSLWERDGNFLRDLNSVVSFLQLFVLLYTLVLIN